ncbi:MAG TPA: hypothetical protein VJK30_01460 [Coxiellaceae bacterium]|nr:MAG: hypothetical protein A3E81_04485 [Gammaproteobacteria bacterium RIFCSPHIGHO2_12_FULL_36_30]HLB55986.1 hypothetical protein [Coxiellaceae bacterium]
MGTQKRRKNDRFWRSGHNEQNPQLSPFEKILEEQRQEKAQREQAEKAERAAQQKQAQEAANQQKKSLEIKKSFRDLAAKTLQHSTQQSIELARLTNNLTHTKQQEFSHRNSIADEEHGERLSLFGLFNTQKPALKTQSQKPAGKISLATEKKLRREGKLPEVNANKTPKVIADNNAQAKPARSSSSDFELLDPVAPPTSPTSLQNAARIFKPAPEPADANTKQPKTWAEYFGFGK